jgi:hypothetical protein
VVRHIFKLARCGYTLRVTSQASCHAKLLKDQQPCQAVVNNLFVDETPTGLAALEKLEKNSCCPENSL